MTDYCLPDYRLNGWRLRSSLPLPELPPWPGDDRLPEVQIQAGPVPERLSGLVASDRHGDLGPDGRFLMDDPGVARFLVEGGRLVTIETAPDAAAAAAVRALIYGTVQGMLCHQRGLFPVHASSVVVGGRAILITGPRGAGKSALAAALAGHGASLLADDVSVLVPGDRPMVLPGLACLNLDPDMIAHLGFPAQGLPPPVWGKCRVPGFIPAAPAPAPLAAVFHLCLDPDAVGPQLSPLSPQHALALLHRSVFRLRLALLMGRGPVLFKDAARLASAIPQHWLLRRPPNLGTLDALAQAVITALDGFNSGKSPCR